MNTELWSPAIDLSGGGMILAQYIGSYNYLSGAEYAATDISTDGGGSWDNLVFWQEDHDAYGPGEAVDLDLTGYAGSADTHLRFVYYSPDWNWWFEVDNVEVALCEPAVGLYIEPEYQAGEADPGASALFDLEAMNFTGGEETVDFTYTATGPGTCDGPAVSDPIADGDIWPFQVTVDVDAGANPGDMINCQIDGVGQNSGDSDTAWIDVMAAYPGPFYDNGPLITHPGGGFGGADASALQTALGLNVYGFGHQWTLGYRVTDGFVIEDAEGWNIDMAVFFAYQTGSPTDPSTITGVYPALWDGSPADPSSSIVWGNYNTNCMVDTEWSGIYRVLDTDMANTQRPIMQSTCEVGIWLPPGEYWWDWNTDGSLSSGPWAPPISILGEITTGDAMQSLDNGATWAPLEDSGTFTVQGLPFWMYGSIPGGEQTMHVGGIEGFFSLDFMGRPVLRMFVLAEDQDAMPLQDVMVDASMWVPDGGPFERARYTKPSGYARFHWGSTASGTWTICVDDLTLEGYVYNPDDNVVTCQDWSY
jgi:hypothetical protein